MVGRRRRGRAALWPLPAHAAFSHVPWRVRNPSHTLAYVCVCARALVQGPRVPDQRLPDSPGRRRLARPARVWRGPAAGAPRHALAAHPGARAALPAAGATVQPFQRSPRTIAARRPTPPAAFLARVPGRRSSSAAPQLIGGDPFPAVLNPSRVVSCSWPTATDRARTSSAWTTARPLAAPPSQSAWPRRTTRWATPAAGGRRATTPGSCSPRRLRWRPPCAAAGRPARAAAAAEARRLLRAS